MGLSTCATPSQFTYLMWNEVSGDVTLAVLDAFSIYVIIKFTILILYTWPKCGLFNMPCMSWGTAVLLLDMQRLVAIANKLQVSSSSCTMAGSVM